MRIEFSDIELDTQLFLLERAGVRIPLRPKVFDLLIHLVEHRERVVPRNELFQYLWGQTVVGAGSLSGLVNELRNALGESGRGDSSIRTVHARGYQFVAEIAATALDEGRVEVSNEVDAGKERGNDGESFLLKASLDPLASVSPKLVALLRVGFLRFVREEMRPAVEAEGIEPLSDVDLRRLFRQVLKSERDVVSRGREAGRGDLNLGPERRMRVARPASVQAHEGNG